MTPTEESRKTVLYDRHRQLNARITTFGGFLMPAQYGGILSEHAAARSAAALFDTCHMGELRLEGTGALQTLELLVSCDLASISRGQCRYGLLCNPEGGVIDDLVVYCFSEREFMVVVNAATLPGDHEWIASHLRRDCEVRNISEETAKIDLQGPKSPQMIQKIVDRKIENLKYYEFGENAYDGRGFLLSRTGYTGEVGFEVYGDPDTVCLLWDRFMEEGAVPAGLGARNTLRLEMGYPLYGNEWSRNRNAAQSGMKRHLSERKRFIGCEAIQGARDPGERLVCVSIEGRKAAREGCRLFSEEGEAIGVVTSGSFAPSLGHAIAMGYIETSFSSAGTKVIADSAGELKGCVVVPPFYKGGTAKNPLETFL
jgi:aminomethyltransferase